MTYVISKRLSQGLPYRELQTCPTIEMAEKELRREITRMTQKFLFNQWNRTTFASEAFKIPRDKVTYEHEHSLVTFNHTYNMFREHFAIEEMAIPC